MKKIHKRQSIIWAGDDHSLEMFVDAALKFSNTTPAQAGVVIDNTTRETPGQGADAKPKSRLLQVEGNVAMISIAGVLTSQNNWWNEYAGLVSYDEIREACHEAASCGASQAMIYFNSPGGSVAGLKDAVDTVVNLGKVMPTYGYTDSQATSAAYWLMSATKKRYASEVATVGSIGVIAKHFEYSKMLEIEGIAATVIRAGEWKALASEVEPLSEKARGEIQDDVNYLYGVFVGSVAELLHTSYQAVDSKMAQGRTFIGAQAVEVGLVDGVSSFDALYAGLLKKAEKTGGDPMKKKYSMTAAMAAASAGVPLGDLEVDMEGGVPPEAADETAATGSEAGGETPEPKAEDAPAPTEAAAPAADNGAVVALLKEQLAAAGEAMIEAKAEAKNAKAALETVQASLKPMQEIVALSINNMLVALGGAVDSSIAGLEPEALVAKHTAVSGDFVKNFKIGGVASVKPDGDATHKQETATVSGIDAARLKLVQPAHNNK